MGLPKDNVNGYKNGSVLEFVDRFPSEYVLIYHPRLRLVFLYIGNDDNLSIVNIILLFMAPSIKTVEAGRNVARFNKFAPK